MVLVFFIVSLGVLGDAGWKGAEFDTKESIYSFLLQ